MVYDLTLMLIGPFDNYSQRADVPSGERVTPVSI